MHKKSFTFGIGTGILAAVLVLFIAYIIQRNFYMNQQADLEMRFVELLEQINEEEMSTVDIVAYALELGMIFPEEPVSDESEIAIDIDEEDVVELHNEDEDQDQDQHENEDEGEDGADEQQIFQPQFTPAITPAPTPPSFVAIDDTQVLIDIPFGNYAYDIVTLLWQAQVISDMEAFAQFLTDNDYDNIIMSGSFVLPINASFEDIISVILPL